MSISLSTCYNNLGLGRWEELCHEVMSSVLPMNDPGMSGDDLSSPTWRIIFLKDDCFLQPSCDMTDTSSLSLETPPHIHNISRTTAINHAPDDDDPITAPSFYSLTSSDGIEPLFDGIDLSHHQQQRHSFGYDQIPPSPSLSRSSSSPSLSDVEDSAPQLPMKRKKHIKNQQTRPTKKLNTQRRRKHGSDRTPVLTGRTLFEQLSLSGIDWCRYCGTTEGVNWRPGPWGKRTLCNKHGCDYKGYGLASRLPRLDLSGYRNEQLEDRHRPVIQEFCSICQERGARNHRHKKSSKALDDNRNNDMELITCDGGCSRAFHRHCFDTENGIYDKDDGWFCRPSCLENRKKQRVVVDLPRKQPLMGSLK